MSQGGWEPPAQNDSAAELEEGDGWETGSNLSGMAGSALLLLGGDGEGHLSRSKAALQLPRPPTRPDVSPPLSGRYFGDAQVSIIQTDWDPHCPCCRRLPLQLARCSEALVTFSLLSCLSASQPKEAWRDSGCMLNVFSSAIATRSATRMTPTESPGN